MVVFILSVVFLVLLFKTFVIWNIPFKNPFDYLKREVEAGGASISVQRKFDGIMAVKNQYGISDEYLNKSVAIVFAFLKFFLLGCTIMVGLVLFGII